MKLIFGRGPKTHSECAHVYMGLIMPIVALFLCVSIHCTLAEVTAHRAEGAHQSSVDSLKKQLVHVHNDLHMCLNRGQR